MFVLALAGKCCCDRDEAELPTTCKYLKNGKNCAATYEQLPYKVRPNDRSTSTTDCEALVRQNAAAKEIIRNRELHAHAHAIRESQPAFRADQALEAAKHNQNKDWRGRPEVTTKFYAQLAKMGYRQEDILWALQRNQYTSVPGTVRILEHEGIQPDPSGPGRDAYRPGAAKDAPAEPAALDQALPPEWKHVPADGKDVIQEYWLYEGSQTWSYHKPVVIAGGWMCIVAPADAANGMDETPYYWNMETGTTQYEAPEEALTSFGLDCPVLTKSGALVETAAGAAAGSREEPRVARRHVPVGANGF